MRRLPINANILIADDEKIIQLLLKYLLEKWGHSVTVVVNGQEAVDACRYFVFDLIILDYRMPIMDGIEAAKQIFIESTDAGFKCHIVLITAAESDDCHSKYIDALICKPIDNYKLKYTIDSILSASDQ